MGPLWKIFTENWDIILMYPVLFAAAVFIGWLAGWAVIRLVHNQRLAHQADMIANLRAVLEEKLPSSFLPPIKRSRPMSFPLILGGLGLALVGIIIAMIGIFGQSPRKIFSSPLTISTSAAAPNAPAPSPISEINYTKTEAENLVSALMRLGEVYDSASASVDKMTGSLNYYARSTSLNLNILPSKQNDPAERRDAIVKILEMRGSALEQLQTDVTALMVAAENKPKQLAKMFEPVDGTFNLVNCVRLYRGAIEAEKQQLTGETTAYVSAALAPANELLLQNIQPFRQRIDARRQEIASETDRIRRYLR